MGWVTPGEFTKQGRLIRKEAGVRRKLAVSGPVAMLSLPESHDEVQFV